MYKDTLYLEEAVVANLFAIGFASAAVSAIFVGKLADTYGRKQACLAYCFLYSLSCLSVFSESLPVLFLGRVLGDATTTLLFSVFETWMVADYRRLDSMHNETFLNEMFGTLATVNSLTAILSGISSEALVQVTESTRAPFAASVLCLIAAAHQISSTWVRLCDLLMRMRSMLNHSG